MAVHARGRRLGGRLLGATLFEAPPGARGIYHAHHANEEMLIVLAGLPSTRTPKSERELHPGEVALFPRGAEGAHAISNKSHETARYLVVSSMVEPDVVEYPEAGAIGAVVGAAPTAGRAAPLELFFPRRAAISYSEIRQAAG